MGKYVTTYIERDGMPKHIEIPKRAINYLNCLKVEINPSSSYEDEQEEAEFSYKGKTLDVSMNVACAENPIWNLESEKKNIVTFSERELTFRRMKTKNDFDYRIIVSQFQNGLSISLWSMITGIHSSVAVVRDYHGNIDVVLRCMGPEISDGSHNVWEVDIHQPAFKQFYMPIYYLRQLKESIDINKYYRCCDKKSNIKVDSKEITREIDLLTTTVSDPEFVKVLGNLMGNTPQNSLPEGKTLKETGNVKIKILAQKMEELI